MPAAALDNMLTMLDDLSEYMASQDGQVDSKRKESAVLITFGSVLGSGAGINIQALAHNTPLKRLPDVSPAT